MKILTDTTNLVEEISHFLQADLFAVDQYISTILQSDTALVREVGTYIRSTQGKRLRPMVTILAARACGYQGTDHPKVAAALELVHTATLLHDDVIDKAPLRRGRPTVNARWGDDVAILVADYLYANAFNLAMQSLPPQVLSLVCQVTARMCEGELFQIEKRDAMLTREDYLRIVRSKTAFLFSACTGLGATLAGLAEPLIEKVAQFGLQFGIAFQITDDTLDMIAPDEDLGKLHGTDIRNGKQTLPLIHALAAAEPADRAELMACWNNGRDAERILKHVHKYQGVEMALDEARNFAAKAREYIDWLPSSPERDLCIRLSEYVVARTH